MRYRFRALVAGEPKPDLKVLTPGCCKGLGAYLGVRASGVTAHGSRLCIKSSTHLLYIAEK